MRIVAAVPTRPFLWYIIRQVSLLLADGTAGRLTLSHTSDGRSEAYKPQAIIKTDVVCTARVMLAYFHTFRNAINSIISGRRSNNEVR